MFRMSSASTLPMFCCKMPPEMGPSLRVCSHQRHKMITVQSIKNNINHIQVDTTLRSIPTLTMLQHRSRSQSSISFWLDSWIFSRLMHNMENVLNMFFFLAERTDEHDIQQHRETRQSDRLLNIYLILTSLTPIFALAEVSMKAQLLNCLARLSPWSLPTTLSSSRSHLLPTSTMGTSSLSLTRSICSRRSWRAQS